ncbi:TPA: DUF2178 domain-containing protein [Candidatus Micrarchaeota archaeon]|nr:DUF2178 domain-containing protein [Candidatus Micrarchaeota archaeon]
MKLKNIVLSAVFTLLLYFTYVSRYSFDALEYSVLFFGLLVAGGLYASREWLTSEEVKSDERTKVIAGKAARFTLVATIVLIIVILAFLAWSGRPTSPSGILAILLGAISLVYSLTYAYLEKM